MTGICKEKFEQTLEILYQTHAKWWGWLWNSTIYPQTRWTECASANPFVTEDNQSYNKFTLLDDNNFNKFTWDIMIFLDAWSHICLWLDWQINFNDILYPCTQHVQFQSQTENDGKKHVLSSWRGVTFFGTPNIIYVRVDLQRSWSSTAKSHNSLWYEWLRVDTD